MAQYRFSSQVIGRATGRSAVAAAAYRAGQSLTDERTGLAHDFSRKRGIAHAEIMAPDNAPDWMRDRARLWNAVELAEKRKDAQLSREVQLSLPHELTDAQRLELVRGFVNSQFVARGMIADVAIHHPDRDSDDRNHHAHIMLTMRELTGEGFGGKARDWNAKELLQTWREEWASQQNRILEREGHAARVDHRSLEAQGFDREPQAHLGPSAHGMEQRGERSRIGDENRAKDAANQNRAEQHRREAVINLAIERHRRQHAEQTALRVHALRDAQRLDLIDLERRHHRQALIQAAALEKQYGAAQRTMSAELAAVQARSQTTGWRGLLRRVTGAEKRDQQQAARLSATLGSIEQRKAEAVGTLRHQQAEERRAVQAKQTARENQLKAELAKQGVARERALKGEAPTRAAIQARAAVERQQAQQPTAAPKRPDRSEQWRNRYRKPQESTGRARDRQEIERQARSPDAATVQARAAVERQQAQQPTARANSVKARQVEPWRVKVPANAVKLETREIEKQAQGRPAPQPEQEAVKYDFDKARIRPQEPRRAPTAPEFVARPAPAPSPSGEVPRPSQRTIQDVPTPAPRRQDAPAPAPKRDWRELNKQREEKQRAARPVEQQREQAKPEAVRKVDPVEQKREPVAPAPKRDWGQINRQAQERSREETTQRDWGASADRSGGAQAGRDWSKSAADYHREQAERPRPERTRDRDFGRER